MRVFKRKAKTSGLTRAQALECTPIRSSQVTEERHQNGEVLLVYPILVRPWLAGALKRLGGAPDHPQLKKLQLDELGTAVWDLMDGNRTVGQVIQDFAARYQLHPREAEVSVTGFLRTLGRRGLVGLT